ncbi:flagella basal body P-ring formation protein FlgA [Sphingomonas sp. BT-65]|uniref:flagella basal body P-ring formation protein FlgA n=1 Tax=Sphingomonas sp. BT-65 TaxID=2989821 RepID=UPI0022360912|nr:flagella basal body P-ring formation protein FlgA [Sphingomonas sp. BT-65]MCW4462490.1 flagella basal body P-ring formation protein FlgA [Sphingomonas sp. BT-65]
MNAILLSALLAGATPAGFQSTEALDRLVEQFAGAPIGDMGGARAPVDKRLKLAACDAPELSWRSAAEDAVVIRCQGPQQWRVFVAVNALPKAAPAAVAPVRPAAPVKAEAVIKRGDPVLVEAGAAGFSITREGLAMADAPAGGRVLVKVDDKRPPVAAIAVEPGRARLPGFGD